MKPLLILAALALGAVSSMAAEVVVAGEITSFSKDTGTLTLLPEDRARTPLAFVNMDRAPIFLATGEIGTVADLQPGRGATIHHSVAGDKLVVSRIVLSAPVPGTAVTAAPVVPVVPAVTLPGATKRALRSPAANDGDITTQPGSKARIDNDITTQPGSKARTDRDITTQPGSKALIDRDITTQPGSKAATDNDITTKKN